MFIFGALPLGSGDAGAQSKPAIQSRTDACMDDHGDPGERCDMWALMNISSADERGELDLVLFTREYSGGRRREPRWNQAGF
jgi:hypothetical protein